MSDAEKIKESDELLETIVGRYAGDTGMLIPMMQDLQAECGYLPADGLRRLARRLDIPLSRVYAVATFYASFRLAPKGAHEVTLCVGTVCHLKGAGDILDAICREFQVEPGGTTPDRLFSIQPVNCLGACALAPVMVVDGEYHDKVTPDSAVATLRRLPPEEETSDGEAEA
ncbi:MAG: NAD(P)H-dependent oxidoreductase subunit E [Planctomycetota bacterium]